MCWPQEVLGSPVQSSQTWRSLSYWTPFSPSFSSSLFFLVFPSFLSFQIFGIDISLNGDGAFHALIYSFCLPFLFQGLLPRCLLMRPFQAPLLQGLSSFSHSSMAASTVPTVCLNRVINWLAPALGWRVGIVPISQVAVVASRIHTHNPPERMGNPRRSRQFEHIRLSQTLENNRW